MSSQKTKFGDKEVNKKEFYLSKEAIFLDSVDLSKIIVSSKWKISDAKYKYFCGYINNGVIQPLCVILPQIRGYIKDFDDDGKNMSFVTDDKEVYKKYNEIWEVRMFKLRRSHIFHCVICSQLLLLCFTELVSMSSFLNDQINIFCCKHLKCYFFEEINFTFDVYLLSVTNKRLIIVIKYD